LHIPAAQPLAAEKNLDFSTSDKKGPHYQKKHLEILHPNQTHLAIATMAPSKDVVVAGSNAVASIDPDQVCIYTQIFPVRQEANTASRP
jgi:hypothetical protein